MKDISSVEASHSHLHLRRGIKLLQRYAVLIGTLVHHIIAMNQGIQMLNAVWNQLWYSNYILVCKPVKVLYSDFSKLGCF